MISVINLFHTSRFCTQDGKLWNLTKYHSLNLFSTLLDLIASLLHLTKWTTIIMWRMICILENWDKISTRKGCVAYIFHNFPSLSLISSNRMPISLCCLFVCSVDPLKRLNHLSSNNLERLPFSLKLLQAFKKILIRITFAGKIKRRLRQEHHTYTLLSQYFSPIWILTDYTRLDWTRMNVKIQSWRLRHSLKYVIDFEIKLTAIL